MKKIITVDSLIAAFISAIGSGLGFLIPKVLGYEEWQCGIISLVAALTLGELAGRIIFSKVIQSSTINRYLGFFAYIIVFIAAENFALSNTGFSIQDKLFEESFYEIIPAILGFVISLIIRQYQIMKIRQRYGDGSDGFLFDEKNIDVNELNQANKQIHGSFNPELAIKTKTGFFVGEKLNDALAFCGIPYAKPPVGKLRWKAPEPLPESEDVFEAKNFGASAIQVDYDGSPLKLHRQSEDCLTLNIYVGSKETENKKPVIVVFHHGDFSYGGSADPILDAEQFNKIYPDAVYVTFNYRLGILGFIDFSEVPGGENYPDALNLGLLDQIAALKWIKENISNFGGDPEQITIFGFESGAVSISLLAACEQAKGLFKKAFVFNGNHLLAEETPTLSRNLAKKLLQETSTSTMDELLKIPTERLKEVSQKLALNLSYPTRDGKIFPVDVYAAYEKNVSGVEIIVGIPSNDFDVYKSSVGVKKYADYILKEFDNVIKFIDKIDPAGTKIVQKYIAEKAVVMSELEAKANFVEQVYLLSAYHCAQKLADGGNKVYILYWNVKPLIENLGSGTIDVLAAFLGNREASKMYGNVLNQDIAAPLQNLFRKFVHGEELKLFNNELKGINAIDWKEFPNALIVSEKKFSCEKIVDRLTEVKGLRELFTK